MSIVIAAVQSQILSRKGSRYLLRILFEIEISLHQKLRVELDAYPS